MNGEDPGGLTVAQVAQRWSVSKRTVARWLSRGLQAYQERPGHAVRIRPADVEQFLRRQTAHINLDELVKVTVRELTDSGRHTGRRER
jgi:excisionase family DNA binding protein